MERMKVVVATHNKGKMKEFEALANKLDFDIMTRDEAGVPHDFDVVEDGTTFEENSYKKAYEIMKMCNLPTLADDSGLMVDALDGAPGVLSARFGGVDGDDQKNKEKLMECLKDVPEGKRDAHFVTVITLVYPDEPEKTIVARGECQGHISTEMRGDQGFGYDPLFIPNVEELEYAGASMDNLGKTFGELGVEFKNTMSHRSKALLKLEELLAKNI